jgi:protein-S-isoprenylcysteine O-methyltransferase Ste14
LAILKVRKLTMKTGSKLAVLLFLAVALAHLLRLLFNLEVTVDQWSVPQWISALGVVVPGLVAWLLWRENN